MESTDSGSDSKPMVDNQPWAPRSEQRHSAPWRVPSEERKAPQASSARPSAVLPGYLSPTFAAPTLRYRNVSWR